MDCKFQAFYLILQPLNFFIDNTFISFCNFSSFSFKCMGSAASGISGSVNSFPPSITVWICQREWYWPSSLMCWYGWVFFEVSYSPFGVFLGVEILLECCSCTSSYHLRSGDCRLDVGLKSFLEIFWSHIFFFQFLVFGKFIKKETPLLRLSLLKKPGTQQVKPPVLAPDAILDQWLQLRELFARVTSSCKWAIGAVKR